MKSEIRNPPAKRDEGSPTSEVLSPKDRGASRIGMHTPLSERVAQIYDLRYAFGLRTSDFGLSSLCVWA